MEIRNADDALTNPGRNYVIVRLETRTVSSAGATRRPSHRGRLEVALPGHVLARRPGPAVRALQRRRGALGPEGEGRRPPGPPSSAGELATDPLGIQRLVEDELLAFVRVDLAHVGGITAARKLAIIAEGHDVETAFHGPPDLSPIGQAATVHFDLALPNFGIQELTDYEERYGDAIGEVFEGGATFDPDVGGLDVPDEPGLGIEVDIDAAESFEYEHSHLPKRRAEDGSVADW